MKISVVFPVKNQTAKLLQNIFDKAVPYYDSLKDVTYEFLICYDGSDEPNQKAMEEAAKGFPLQIKLLPYENHKGKGHNVQRGFAAASGDYVMFMDADFSTDLHALEKMLPILPSADCFIGTRHGKGGVITTKQTLLRRLISFASRWMIKGKFHFTGLSDTQCGYKLFRTDVAKAMAKKEIIDGFAFDVEELYFLQLNGFKTVEVPVVWSDDPDSTLGNPVKTSLAFYKDMMKIKKNKKNYLLSAEERKALASRE
jgi:dolichyl-phosphate beta-glucosyltransferase